MTNTNFLKRSTLSTAMAALLAASIGASIPARAAAQPAGAVSPTNELALSVGAGQMVRLDGTMSDLFIANDNVADVQVRSANQLYVFGKGKGETTVYATNRAGKVIYSATVRVGPNLGSIDQMLDLAMPGAQIQATPMNGLVLLTGTVPAPADVEEATRLVQAYLGEGTQVLSRLKTATPLQVMLKVKIAEVSRSLTRQIGTNILTSDTTGGFQFGIARGGSINPTTGAVSVADIGATLQASGLNVFGVDIISALDLSENSGLVTVLAEPILAALSGETASFLAGGEFPIATSSGLNGTAIEFKEYGVSLAFTPTVLEGGRISMRVRPEVSELVAEGSITIGGLEIPGISTRRAETTVELGSGQSFMIGGLLRNNANNSVDKVPVLGDIPILGALFRSKTFRRNESELVIVVTPYLVKPINASQIALPTDGYRMPDEASSTFLDQREEGRTGEQRPGPTIATPPANPGVGSVGSASLPPPRPALAQQVQRQVTRPKGAPSAAPGFTFK